MISGRGFQYEAERLAAEREIEELIAEDGFLTAPSGRRYSVMVLRALLYALVGDYGGSKFRRAMSWQQRHDQAEFKKRLNPLKNKRRKNEHV